jgi:hypothetical protein
MQRDLHGRKHAMKYVLSAAVMAASLTAWTATAQAQENVIGSLTEEEMGKALDFGMGVGKTFLCVDEADQQEMKEDIRMVFNFVAQDMGTDAAYVFAVGVGSGAHEKAEGLKCESLLSKWGESREAFGLTEEGQ